VKTGSVLGWSPTAIRVRRSTTIWAASVARIMTNIVALRFHSGLTTTRSIATPSAATAATATSAAKGRGTPFRANSTWVIMPPSITNAPWAKFTMPLAL
jgi:hypothetical protein